MAADAGGGGRVGSVVVEGAHNEEVRVGRRGREERESKVVQAVEQKETRWMLGREWVRGLEG